MNELEVVAELPGAMIVVKGSVEVAAVRVVNGYSHPLVFPPSTHPTEQSIGVVVALILNESCTSRYEVVAVAFGRKKYSLPGVDASREVNSPSAPLSVSVPSKIYSSPEVNVSVRAEVVAAVRS